jgi:glycosyltransferase involved in cell wall biosynthesis
MPRLLIISSLEAAPWGAADNLWRDAAVAARQRGWSVTASVKGWEVEPYAWSPLRLAGVELHPREFCAAPASGGNGRDLVVAEYLRLLEVAHPDLVLISMPDNFSGLGWVTACRTQGTPYAVLVHYTASFEWPDDTFFQELAQGYSDARRCFFVSHRSLRMTEQQIARHISHAEIVRTPYAVDYDVDLAWPDENVLRLAIVGRFDIADKGHDIVLEVLHQEKWRARPLSVSICGRDGPHERLILALIEFWGLEQVRMVKNFQNVADIWMNHHGLLLPSRAEGLPAAIVEAMLCSRMCVVTDVAGNGELLKEGNTGFIASFPDPGALDETLERAWQQRHRWYEMGQRARLAVREAVPRHPGQSFLTRLECLLP